MRYYRVKDFGPPYGDLWKSGLAGLAVAQNRRWAEISSAASIKPQYLSAHAAN